MFAQRWHGIMLARGFAATFANVATAAGAALTLVTLHLHRGRLRRFMHVRPVRANVYRERSPLTLQRDTSAISMLDCLNNRAEESKVALLAGMLTFNWIRWMLGT